jgi:hypothetical protein
MLKSIPWDVWVAATVAAVVALLALFDPGPAMLVVIYLFLCAYVVVSVIDDKIAG